MRSREEKLLNISCYNYYKEVLINSVLWQETNLKL